MLPVFRTTGNVTMLHMTSRTGASLVVALRLVTSPFGVEAQAGQQSAQQAADSAPAGATARCRDESYSYSHNRSGTCAHHGGVARWFRVGQPSVANDTFSVPYFYPDGYFFPEHRISVGLYEIYMLRLSTLNFFYGGKAHYDKPEPVTWPQFLAIRLRSDTTKGMRAAVCTDRKISPDTLYLKCESKSLGMVTVEGNFLDKGGDFGNHFSNVSHADYVLSAVITVSRGGRVLYRGRHRFSYLSDD